MHLLCFLQDWQSGKLVHKQLLLEELSVLTRPKREKRKLAIILWFSVNVQWIYDEELKICNQTNIYKLVVSSFHFMSKSMNLTTRVQSGSIPHLAKQHRYFHIPQQRSSTWPRKQPTEARKNDAKSPANVPSTLIAPSVPLGTILNVVAKYLQILHQLSNIIGQNTCRTLQ